MEKHTYRFVDSYDGLVGFGLDRKTNENTVMYCLQKFAEDRFMEQMKKRLTDEELEEIFNLIMRLAKAHLSEQEYHRLFLKDK